MKVAVVGAGPGGVAVAGHAGLKGFEVLLHDIRQEAVTPIQERGGIRVQGMEDGFAPVVLATTDVAPVVRDADLVILTVPGPQQAEVARALSRYVRKGQVILVKPGGTGGALEVKAVLARAGVEEVDIAETAGFVYSCGIPEPGTVRITAIKQHFAIAAIPAVRTPMALTKVQALYPQARPAPTVLHTSLTNINAILHLAPMVVNAGWIERTNGQFDFYGDGITEAVARVIQITDNERMSVAQSLGVEVPSLLTWAKTTYGVVGNSVLETVRLLHREVYGRSLAPPRLEHRYLTEDVPCGAVPVADLGQQLGTDVSVTRHCIALASALLGRDLWAAGRTMERLGLGGLSASAIRKRVA